MSLGPQMVLLAAYNAWMNAKVYAAAARLSEQDLVADRNAFFGSVLGTLNHIAVADTIWLKRFAQHPAGHAALDPVRSMVMPATLDQLLFTDLAALSVHRNRLDNIINEWAASLSEDDLTHVLEYTNTKGIVGRRKFAGLVLHFFNHQTHHRGQTTTLLHQAGQDVGVTDLLTLVANEPQA
jgi:uncharacterized damage-inducible protein DinB